MLNLKPIPGAPTKAPKANKPEPRGRQKWNTAAHDFERDDSKPQAPKTKSQKNEHNKAHLVRQMCLLMGIGEGATPSNQVYGDGYFANALERQIKESGYMWSEIEDAARAAAKEYLKQQIQNS